MTTSELSNIDRSALVKGFGQMKAVRQVMTNQAYTHFIPATDLQINKPSNPNPWTYPIYECNCSPQMGRSSRDTVENELLEKVGTVFDKSKQLNLYSLGSGNCYQELSFCVKLAEQGYQVRQIVLVDRAYDFGLEEFAIVEFSKFFQLLFPNAQIFVYKEEEEYFDEIKNSKQAKPDIILCIDVEKAHESSRKMTYSKMLESNSSQLLC